MPNKKASIKSLRQDKKKNLRNKTMIASIRTLAKKARTLITSEKREEADSVLKNLESKLSKAAKNNTITRENAGRRISRLRGQWAKIGSKA